MNEFFAAEPTCCKDASELRLLLSRFGPYAGRYLAEYPEKWAHSLTARLEEKLGPVEAERVKTCLRRAHEQGALLANRSLEWDENSGWLDNAKKLVLSVPPKLNALVVSQENAHEADITLDNFETRLPLTADEKVHGTVEEYLRVSRTLLAISPELFFADPYLNPCRKKNEQVMEGMLKRILRSPKCKRVSCFARTKLVVGERLSTRNEVANAWDDLLKRVGWTTDRVFEYVLVDDDMSKCDFHHRSMISIKGGIWFDRGFEVLPKKRLMVGTLNATLLEEQLGLFKDGNHDWKREYEFHN